MLKISVLVSDGGNKECASATITELGDFYRRH